MSSPVSLAHLLAYALKDAHIFEASEREGVAEKLADSVAERMLHRLADEEPTRNLAERLQEVLLHGDDLLVAATRARLTRDDAFASVFSVVLAEILDEIIELTETDDATELRRRLHDAVIGQMQEAQE